MDNLDLRLVAIILVVSSVLMGIYLPASILLLVTFAIIFSVVVIMRKVNKNYTQGTSGGLGVFYLCVGFSVFTLIPIWIAYLVRNR